MHISLFYFLALLEFAFVNNLRDKDLLIAFGEHLVNIRKSKNIAQNELAYKADVEISQIFRIEKGKINPTLSTLKNIANALDISLQELLNF
jgi:transcriptional regulator with XRE-family HTH domain